MRHGFPKNVGPWHQHPQVCLHIECGRGSLQAWTDVDSMVVLQFCGLLCSINGSVFSFDTARLSVFRTMCVCVDVNPIFCVLCRQNGSERIRARGVASSFQKQKKTVCVSSFCGCCGCCVFLKFALGIRAFFLNGFTDREAPHK